MSDKKKAYIYALTDADGSIRYVGSTGMNVNRRSAIHFSHRNQPTDRANPGLTAWIRSLDAPPRSCLLQVVAWEDRFKAEAAWTRMYRSVYGDTLLNILDGATPTAETVERRKRNKSGHYKPHTDRSRDLISKGVKKSWEFRKACMEEQHRLEAELGSPLEKIPAPLWGRMTLIPMTGKN